MKIHDFQPSEAIAFEQRTTGISFFSAVAVGAVSAVMWLFLSNIHFDLTFILGYKPTFWLWPPNYFFVDQLAENHIAKHDALLFLNSGAVTSLLYLLWLVGRLIFEFVARRHRYVSKDVLTICALALIPIIFVAFKPFSEEYSRYSLSFEASVQSNIFHNIIIIGGFYACLGESLAKIISLIRVKMQ
ncbi:hypothetical protein [Neorhizobium alkalisoli]|uniref:hypothetical protein n=1 Tax=Neorhizobium alkalisoli TaxID=528178 RepID=UPI000CF8B26D|nr:hypothetical protein [Neorhizobium alkalisoli]